jgi:hypothetical protein
MSDENLKNTQNTEEQNESLPSGNQNEKACGKTKTGLDGMVICLLFGTLILLIGMICLSIVIVRLESKNRDDIASLSTAQAKVSSTINEMNENLVSVSDVTDRLGTYLATEFSEDVAQENDVTIGGEYVIKSTEEMTQAYKAGDTSSLTDDEKACLELAQGVLDEIITDDMTEYEKELAVYEWMCANLKHDDGITVAIPTTGEYADNPYGVLSTKKAVCVGFATTFRMFMEMLDIKCMVVHDSYLSHSWDEVQLDGDWYYVDVYMDVQTTTHANFNMNDELCKENHDWNTDFFPSATGTKYCYAVQNGEDFESLEQIASEIREVLDGGITETLIIKLSGEDMYVNYELIEELASSVDNYIDSSELSENCYAYYSATKMDDELIIFTYNFVNYEYEEGDDWEYQTGDITDEQYQGLQDAIDSAFSDFYDKHTSVYDGDDYYDYGYDEYDDYDAESYENDYTNAVG